MKNSLFARWQANSWAGLVIVLPAVISIAVLVWLSRTVANITDTLLIFLPRAWTHQDDGKGPLYWYFSLMALVVAVALIGMIGWLARYYFGKRAIEWTDSTLMRIPLLNKIYSATKQVNSAFSSSNKTAFRTVVRLEFPKEGVFSIGFITGEPPAEMQARSASKLMCVFVPLTPNPTSGYLMLVPEEKLTKLDMSVADGIKYVVSLGSILPEAILAAPPGIRVLPAAPTAARYD